jgi:hypothetical protein
VAGLHGDAPVLVPHELDVGRRQRVAKCTFEFGNQFVGHRSPDVLLLGYADGSQNWSKSKWPKALAIHVLPFSVVFSLPEVILSYLYHSSSSRSNSGSDCLDSLDPDRWKVVVKAFCHQAALPLARGQYSLHRSIPV